jgi:DNA polymerase
MRTLCVDIETFSSVDLTACGVYPYTEALDFAVLLFGYAFDDEPVRVVDLAQGEALPAPVLQALTDPAIIKTAYNASFERTCLARWLGRPMPPEQWRCTMALAATLGLPGSLDGVADALRLSQDKQKMTAAGKTLIRYFSTPCAPTASNGGRTRNLPQHDPDKWALFKLYCGRDVEVERAVRNALAANPMPEIEQRTWELDQRINAAGVRIDRELVDAAIRMDTAYQARLEEEARRLTGLENPGSVPQLKGWLAERGVVTDSLDKEQVGMILAAVQDPDVRRALELRQAMAKTSTAKYDAMVRGVCADARVRGLLQYYGANRTGRWTGRQVQVQNLPQNHLPDLDLARKLVRAGRADDVELVYDSLPVVLSQLIRTAFIPAEGCCFIVADYSAIEARVIAWLAGEKWVLDEFRGAGKIYEAAAARMFRVPVESITKGSDLRQKGKVATLSCGYNGGPAALIKMGALKQGLKEEELPGIVAAWRKANPRIVEYWKTVENAALDTVETGEPQELPHGIRFELRNNTLFLRLPSGRRLAYLSPKIQRNRFGGQGLTYAGVNQNTKAWGRLDTYGGKLVENIVQATARDCLRDAMLALDAAGYRIVMHVHDEVVIEAPADGREQEAMQTICEIMGRPLPWAAGLPLRADGSVMKYYRKD